MAANAYYNQQAQYDRQHLLSPGMSSPALSSPGFPSPGLSSGQPSPLKSTHVFYQDEQTSYQPTAQFQNLEKLNDAANQDIILKSRIRRLRVVSRAVAFVISIGVLVPLLMTLIKFEQTKDVYQTVVVNGKPISRTAWAKDSRTWPTYVYFGVAAISTLLNAGTMLSYCCSVEKANVASYVTSTFSWIVLVGNLAVWAAAAAVYKKEKEKTVQGKHTDLWGWTCSGPAKQIQKEFAQQVDFNQYCVIQSASWYIGLAQVGAALLTIVIYVFVYMRTKSKKRLNAQLKLNGFEPARH
ncbi:hypothetical protein DE146DRAFT_661185 [Phaeosphaeria sp. MPI-PUGE-AT-0046c]|nr:hypothetical protein DE146DRAFT_661185 [Phaeosphaeria sp. MPI-PUGE-AT-0046c]